MAAYTPEKLWLASFAYQAYRGYYNTSYRSYINDYVRAKVGGGKAREDVRILQQLEKGFSGDKGWSVGIDFSSDRSRVRAVVGCLRNDKAYVFETAGQGPWPEVARLLPDDPPVDSSFGRSVSISGETVLVGAYLPLVNDSPSGTYVFTRSGAGSWLRETRMILAGVGDVG